MLLGQKITERVAEMRDLPAGIDQRSACRHPDWTGPDDPRDQDRRAPRDHRLGEARLHQDRRVAAAVRRAARGQVGRRRGGARRHAGRHRGDPGRVHRACRHPDAPRRPPRRRGAAGARHAPQGAARRLGRHQDRADAAKALALGADAVSIGSAAMVALGCNRPVHIEDYHAIGTEPGACHHCHTGRCPVGITTQDADLETRLDPEQGARRLQQLPHHDDPRAPDPRAGLNGKSHVLNLEPEDLAAVTVEAAAMAQRAARRHRLDPGAFAVAAGGKRESGPGGARGPRPNRRAAPDRTNDRKFGGCNHDHGPRPSRETGRIRYFLICFADLFGTLRSKLVPARAIGDMQRDGAGFAGFAAWLDMTPADPDMFAMPDRGEPHPAPVAAARSRWLAGRPVDERGGGGGVAPHRPQAPDRGGGEAGLPDTASKTGVECEFFLAQRPTAGRDLRSGGTSRRSPATTRRR